MGHSCERLDISKRQAILYTVYKVTAFAFGQEFKAIKGELATFGMNVMIVKIKSTSLFLPTS